MYCDDLGHCHDSIYAEKPKNVLQVREFARKKSIELAIKRYFAGMKGARDKRYFYNDGKKMISEKLYREMIATNKNDLAKTLSGLLRKGDRIEIPRE